MKLRKLLMMLVSVLVAMLLAWGVNQWIEQRIGLAEEKGETAQVVVAATDIPVGTKIDPTHVKFVEIPIELVPAESYPDTDELLGSVVKQNLYAGEIVIQRRVKEDASGSRLASLIEEGMRAITVRVDDVTGVAGFLLPGSRIDMIAIGKEAKTILQDLKILAIGQQVETSEEGAVSVHTITLEVDPRQAEIVANAGNVRLTLRNPVDHDQVEEPETQVAMAEPRPPQRRTLFAIDVIRGTSLSTTTVQE